ncbi:glycine--tRNA ligase subunit beta [Enterobacteriaceae endosymbiont of Plateumaris consimilis]|uniref:glycine--tRNA ligase subunit beta n=1 Tax=Enterobacteriaceae endosymbiont of Plateumaris consimilis TaxID=2675794 RepID=UPI00144901FD|nr:glycine--tRNA ligase subunit beta [Enterobacteriaceae endosymbiont of Plateumaris consimilis]QJC28474.1 glycine--tRNA ligase subunit beta [Enterobacteriaceae endosymbiont of Plateumaris consimilis]
MKKETLLLEIGIEDIPSQYLLKTVQIIFDNFKNELKKNNFLYKKIVWFATPRRIAIQVSYLNTVQLNYILKIKGPNISSFNNKNIFSINIVKHWIKKYQIKDIKKIFIKCNYLFYNKQIKGVNIKYLLTQMIMNSLKDFSLPNLMYWNFINKYNLKFIRPIRTIIVFLGNKNIKINILNIKSSKIIFGHRFISKSKIILENADQYEQFLLDKGNVIVDFLKRKNKILNNIKKIAYSLNGSVNLSNSFLEELTSMVEWPVILSAKFDSKFLSLPSKILEYIMIKYQRYIPLYDIDKNLLPNFIFISNVESQNNDLIIQGNEKVIKSRFEDAQFFFKNDSKKKLEQYVNKLQNIIFQKDLGNLLDKTIRLTKLSKYIAIKIKANVNNCIRASQLAKCDLATTMVHEFPELQGIIGMYYAKYNGENIDVCISIKEQYQYKLNDKIPHNVTSCVLFLSDKIDTLVGIFGISLFPTSSKDPFALKRIALVIIKIIINNKLNLNLLKLIKVSMSLYNRSFNNKNIINDLMKFIINRCQNWYISLGYQKNIIKAVLTNIINKPLIIDIRIKALSLFLQKEKKQSKLLIYTCKRINKILLKYKYFIKKEVNLYLLKEKEEIILSNHLLKLSKIFLLKIKDNEYYNILLILSELYYPINNFFKNVIIDIKNIKIKTNRITILNKINQFFLKVFNINQLY